LLKQGVAAWNKWRDENANIRPNLNEANLRDANLSEVNLNEADLMRANLSAAPERTGARNYFMPIFERSRRALLDFRRGRVALDRRRHDGGSQRFPSIESLQAPGRSQSCACSSSIQVRHPTS
jgi:hypothetical protein